MDNEKPNNIKQVVNAAPSQPANTAPTQTTNPVPTGLLEPAKPTKSNKSLIVILVILLILALAAGGAFAYLYFSNNLQTQTDTSNTITEISESIEVENESKANTVSIAQVESLLRDKYKFNAQETVFIDGWPKYIENLDQANKILFTIYQLKDGDKFGSEQYLKDEAAIVRNISFDDFNNAYIYYFGNIEPLEKKDYKLNSVISKIVYRSGDDSFDVYFPDGIGGYSTIRLLSKVDNITPTKDGFKATVLAVTLDSRVEQDTEEFLGKSSQGDGKWFYEIIMTDDVLDEIRDSLSAYEFNFKNDDDEYKLVSIEKI